MLAMLHQQLQNQPVLDASCHATLSAEECFSKPQTIDRYQ